MTHIDLFELRIHFNQSRILLCFNGPISRSLIEEIGNRFLAAIALIADLLQRQRAALERTRRRAPFIIGSTTFACNRTETYYAAASPLGKRIPRLTEYGN